MMQLKRKVVLSTLGAMLIASIFICNWFRPEAVRERNLDFLKHEAVEFIREQSADNIFSYEKFESGEYRTYTCNINDVYISGPILSIVEKNNELLDGGISWVVSVNGEIIGTIELLLVFIIRSSFLLLSLRLAASKNSTHAKSGSYKCATTRNGWIQIHVTSPKTIKTNTV